MTIRVKPWTKNGRVKRLYVNDEQTKQSLGWIDPHTFEGHLSQSSRYLEYAIALKAYGIPADKIQTIIVQAQGRQTRDLACNKPGEQALAKVQELTKGLSPTNTKMVYSLGYKSAEQSWIQGAEGERLVGTMLNEQLPAPWRVLHAVPIGTEGSDIDHLVIGPGGIFNINTKSHPGSHVVCVENQIKIHGAHHTQSQSYTRNARFESTRVARILSDAVGTEVRSLGIIAYICQNLDIYSQPKDNRVIHVSADRLVSKLLSMPTVYPTAFIEELFSYARNSATWEKADYRKAARLTKKRYKPQRNTSERRNP